MPLILPGNVGSATAATGFNVANSLRFAGAARDTYLTATFGSAPTLATKNTISLWFKRSTLDTLQQLYAANGNTANIIVNSNNTIAFYTNSGQLLGPRLYRDTSAWMHFVFTFDSTQGTAANRFKVYINGVEETSFNNTAYPAQNEASQLGVNGEAIKIGTRSNHDRIFEGYMAETAFVDGQALDATSFGEFDEDSGIWKPIDVSGLTFGNNGFYLDFEASDNLGNDANGGTDLAESGLAATDQSTDTCTNNFATMNSLDNFYAAATLSEGNTQIVTATTPECWITGTVGLSTGKWFWEQKVIGFGSGGTIMTGIADRPAAAANLDLGKTTFGWQYTNGGYLQHGDANLGTWTQTTYTTNDIIGTALDIDNNLIYFYKNGTLLNSGTGIAITAVASTANGFWFPAFGDYNSGSATLSVNFGSPSFAISSGNTDGDGYGNFEYAVPSGYYALCTKNLAEYG